MRARVTAALALAVLCGWGFTDLIRPTSHLARVWPLAVALSIGSGLAFIVVAGGLLMWGEVRAGVAVVAVLWGLSGAILFTNRIEPPLLASFHGGDWSVAVVDAPTEEVAKLAGIALLAALFPDVRRRPVRMMVMGAITGVGFQVAENHLDALLAMVNNVSDPLGAMARTWLQRTAELGVWLHPADSAIAAVAVAVWTTPAAFSRRRRVIISAGAIALAAALHFYWDSPIIRGAGVAALFAGDIPRVGAEVASVALVYRAVRQWPVTLPASPSAPAERGTAGHVVDAG